MRLLRVMSVVFVVLAMTSMGQAALVGHWTFDEASGPALDSSGNGFNGTIVGTVTRGQAGQIGGAYLFAGAGWVDFGAGTVTTKITNFPITISYWLKSTATATTECAVWMGKRSTDNQYLQTGMKNGNAQAAYRNLDFDNSVAWKDGGTTHTEANGAWHHIVAVYPDTTVRHVYVDGVLAASKTFTQAYSTLTNQVAVGNNNRRTTLTDPFDGSIDDVQIWDEALDAGRVAAIYAAGLGDVAANPLPLGNAIDPAVTTALSWDAPQKYTPDTGYNLVLHKGEPNFAGPGNIIQITDATAVSPTTVSLDYDSTYYWRVDAYEPNGIAGNAADDIFHPGVVWSFSTLVSLPVITEHPVAAFVNVGETAQFQIGFESVSPPQFAWYKSGDEANDTPGDDNLIASGSTALTVSNVQPSDEGFYYCVLTNGSGTPARSNVAGLKLKQLLAWYKFENDGLDSAGANHGFSNMLMGYSEGIVAADGQAYAAEPNGLNYFSLSVDSYPKTGFGNGLTHFTYSCWVKMNSNDGGILLGAFNSDQSTQNTGLRLSVNTGDGSISCYLRQEGGASNAVNINNLPIADGQWHAVTVTNNGSQLVAYFDGLAQGTSTFNLTNFGAWEFPLYLLAVNSRGTANQNYRGKADDLRIYNYALSADEVLWAYYNVTGKKVCVQKPALDLNNNCVVDMADLAMLAASWLESGLRPIN